MTSNEVPEFITQGLHYVSQDRRRENRIAAGKALEIAATDVAVQATLTAIYGPLTKWDLRLLTSSNIYS